MEFHCYRRTPGSIQEEIIAARQKSDKAAKTKVVAKKK